MDTRTIERLSLAPEPVADPVIVAEYDTSVVAPPDCRAALDKHDNIVKTVGGR